jgi:hypothetical protein
VSISKILFSRATGVETWITSDGRAYFVHLTEVPEDVQNDGEAHFPNNDTRARVSGSTTASSHPLIMFYRLLEADHARQTRTFQKMMTRRIPKSGKECAYTISIHQDGSKSKDA